MLKKLENWFSTKPATKAAWIAALTGILAIIVNAYVIYQNSQSIRTAQQAFYLSIPPSVDLIYPAANQPPVVYVQNTGPYSLVDVKVYAISYLFDGSKMIGRSQSAGYIASSESLQPKQQIEITASNLLFNKLAFQSFRLAAVEEGRIELDGSHPQALVTVFRRELDQKRFIKIEPYHAIKIEDSIHVLPMYVTLNRGRTTMEPQVEANVVIEIQRTEKLFFGFE